MSLFDKDLIENEEQLKQTMVEEENIALLLGTGVCVVETNDTESFVASLLEKLSVDYAVLSNGPLADRLKSQQGRPVYRWDAKTFKKYDAIGSMYQLSKLPKEAKPIVIIENIADIPDGDRNIYDDPEHVENVLLHSWKNDTIHLTYKGVPFQMNKGDYTVIFPVKPGDLQKLHHGIKSDGFGFVQF